MTAKAPEGAAKITGIDRDDIAWWLEERGIYKGERWSVGEMVEKLQLL